MGGQKRLLERSSDSGASAEERCDQETEGDPVVGAGTADEDHDRHRIEDVTPQLGMD